MSEATYGYCKKCDEITGPFEDSTTVRFCFKCGDRGVVLAQGPWSRPFCPAIVIDSQGQPCVVERPEENPELTPVQLYVRRKRIPDGGSVPYKPKVSSKRRRQRLVFYGLVFVTPLILFGVPIALLIARLVVKHAGS